MVLLGPDDYQSNLLDGFLGSLREMVGDELSVDVLGTLRNPETCPEKWLPVMAELRGVLDLDTTLFGIAPRRELMKRAYVINGNRTTNTAIREFFRVWGYEYVETFRRNAGGKIIGGVFNVSRDTPTTAAQVEYLREKLPLIRREDFTLADGDLIILTTTRLSRTRYRILSSVYAPQYWRVP